MGQRLNIEINRGEKHIANAYYHWSGYTSSAIKLAETVVDSIKGSDKPDLERALVALELTDARLTLDERTELEKIDKELFDKIPQDHVDRNSGLIAVSEAGMQETRHWSEGDVSIDLEDGTIDFSVFFDMDKEEWVGDYSQEEYDALPKLGLFTKVEFSKFPEFVKNINKHHEFVNTEDENRVYGWIE